MKIYLISCFILVSALSYNNLYAQSISFTGNQCTNSDDLSDTTSNNVTITSRFTVTDDAGDGIYALILTGGYPRISSFDDSFCIDTFLGHAGDIPPNDTPEAKVLPKDESSVKAIGYFNGNELTIIVNSIQSTLSGSVNTESPYQFFYSPSSANSNIFIFRYEPSNQFGLKTWIRISSIYGGFGFSAPPGFYSEYIKPNDAVDAMVTPSTPKVIYQFTNNQ